MRSIARRCVLAGILAFVAIVTSTGKTALHQPAGSIPVSAPSGQPGNYGNIPMPIMPLTSAPTGREVSVVSR